MFNFCKRVYMFDIPTYVVQLLTVSVDEIACLLHTSVSHGNFTSCHGNFTSCHGC